MSGSEHVLCHEFVPSAIVVGIARLVHTATFFGVSSLVVVGTRYVARWFLAAVVVGLLSLVVDVDNYGAVR